MKRPKPLVSVITTTYNRDDLLFSRCIRSVRAQTYSHIEHIVVCDQNRTAAPRLRAEAPEVRYVEINDIGHDPTADLSAGAHGWFIGTHLAKGKYIAFLGDDDEYLPHHVERHVAMLEKTGADYSLSVVDFCVGGEHVYYVGDGQLALAHLDFISIVARRANFNVCNLVADGGDHPDFNLVWGWHQAGLKGAFVPEVTAKHHDGWLARSPEMVATLRAQAAGEAI